MLGQSNDPCSPDLDPDLPKARYSTSLPCANEKQTKKEKAVGCCCNNSNEFRCNFVLKDFLPNRYTHPVMKEFSEFVSTRVRYHLKQGFDLDVIEIKGFTDGILHLGTPWRTVEPKKCRLFEEGDYKDNGLGLIRSCMVKNSLLDGIGKKLFIISKLIEAKPYDVPDEGVKGPSYRKVGVQVSFIGECK